MIVLNLHPQGYEHRAHNHEPDLYEALRLPLANRGHSLITSYGYQGTIPDVVCIDLNVWDLADNNDGTPRGTYSTYPQWAKDLILSKNLPVVIFDNFDHHGTPTYFCTWPGRNDWDDLLPVVDTQDWAKFLRTLGKSKNRMIYFMRKMQKSAPYPEWVYPLEYPLFNDWPLVSKEELFARPFDVCFLAEDSLIRRNAIAGLRADGRLQVDCSHIPSNQRLPFDEWVDRHRQAKMFLEADSSMGSERPMRLMTVAPMLRVKSDHKLPFPRTDGVHQIEIGDYDGKVTADDVDKVLAVIRDPERLYAIYVQGAEHMRQCYSMEARSRYIIDTIESKLCK